MDERISEILVNSRGLPADDDARLTALKKIQSAAMQTPHSRKEPEKLVADNVIERVREKQLVQEQGKVTLNSESHKTIADPTRSGMSIGVVNPTLADSKDVADKQSGQLDEQEKVRQAKMLEEIHGQFRVSGSKFHFKDQPQKLAFKDNGEKMVSSSNDDGVAKAMAAMAEAKGWDTIKVSGHPDFQREVWMEANLRGIEVQGFKPKEQDLKLLEIKRELRMRNAVEQVETKLDRSSLNTSEISADATKTSSAKNEELAKDLENNKRIQELLATEKEALHRSAIDKSNREGSTTPKDLLPKNEDLLKKRVQELMVAEKAMLKQNGLESGSDKGFSSQQELSRKNEEFIKKGVQENKAAYQANEREKEDNYKAPAVKIMKFDHSGKLISSEYVATHPTASDVSEPSKTKDSIQNDAKKMDIEKAVTQKSAANLQKSEKVKIVDIVAGVMIDSMIKNPAQRDVLRAAISEQLAIRKQLNKVPAIPVYDKTAPSKNHQERTGPVIERTPERTR
ncbi:MAG: hypothetical protein EOP04_00695 [Proteobacteria bacterium]|nr:MAG: hypothetical protein EOP04_00695 [Pseudomonadota bacterium]